ncbi:MAG: hypothetical protein ACLTEG_09400 [Acutalibacter sp.]
MPCGKTVMLIDTVGLIRLPHHLVEAFKSTLEQAATADILELRRLQREAGST